MDFQENTHTVTTITKTVTITKKDILEMLGIESGRVFVSIPGGGDWSNCDMDIDSKFPIYIVTKEVIEQLNGESP